MQLTMFIKLNLMHEHTLPSVCKRYIDGVQLCRDTYEYHVCVCLKALQEDRGLTIPLMLSPLDGFCLLDMLPNFLEAC